MKKLMVIAAVIALATATQAATFMWKVSTGSAYAGMNVYAITGTTAAEVIAAFSATDSADNWVAAVKGAIPVVAADGSRGTASGDTINVADGDNLVFAIVNGGIAEGNDWYVLADYTIPAGATFTPPTTGQRKTIAVGTPTSGTFQLAGPTPTPEPTSGLLLVLGMAGLALRRKMK